MDNDANRAKTVAGIELTHIFHALIIIGSVSGWGLGIWATLQNDMYVDKANIQMLQQRQTSAEGATADLRVQMGNLNIETRAQLAKISDQIADIRILVAGMRDGLREKDGRR